MSVENRVEQNEAAAIRRLIAERYEFGKLIPQDFELPPLAQEVYEALADVWSKWEAQKSGMVGMRNIYRKRIEQLMNQRPRILADELTEEAERIGTEIFDAIARKMKRSDGIENDGEICTLGDCRPGLFEFKGDLGFRTEYEETTGAARAYCLDSGEAFWGGAHTGPQQALLKVQPVKIKRLGA